MASTCSPQGGTKLNRVNLFREHLAMETILAIDLGKRNSVFCRLDSSSLKPEYFTEELKVSGTFSSRNR